MFSVMQTPFVSVIIPTYNRSKLLSLTLDSFLEQTYPVDCYEIIVSDNNSTDDTADQVSELINSHNSRIRYLFEKHQGVHYARNSAAKIARGDILYFTDDDMLADSNLLKNLVAIFNYDPFIAVVTGRILPRFEVQPPEWVERYLINAYLSLTDRDRPEQLVVSLDDKMVYSCHQAILRDVFIKSGGFNPENTAGIWIGDGETGLNIKIRSMGYRFAYTASSIIYHMIPKERMTLSYLVRRVGNQGYCDSYTEYRSHRDRSLILSKMLLRSSMGAFKLLVTTLGLIMLGRESWHFIPARLAYLHKRNIYDLKLLFDDKFRKLVEIDDWLNNDLPEMTF